MTQSATLPAKLPLSPRPALLAGSAMLSGALIVCATATIDIWPLAYVSLVPLLFVITLAPTMRRALFYAWLAGLIANLGGFYWIASLLHRYGGMPAPVAALGPVLLAAYQALVFVLFAAMVRRLCGRTPEPGQGLPMAAVAPIAMVTAELVVPFIFPWYLAITQAWVPPVIQVAELAGPLGVTALVAMVNGALCDMIAGPTRRRLLCGLAATAIMAGALGFGWLRIAQVRDARAQAPAIAVGLVQSNFSLAGGASGRPSEPPEQELAGLQAVSAKLEAQGAELIVWTEGAFPYAFPREATSDFASDHPLHIRRGISVPVVVGAITRSTAAPRLRKEQERPYNTAFFLGEDGAIRGRYDKIHLLLFGEYTPLVDTFPALQSLVPDAAGQFRKGNGITTFPLQKNGRTYRLGPMICYEDILPAFGRALSAHHPHLLVNLTNDTWFGDTAEPWQHLALAVFRAVEARTDMVRAVNTGVSAHIDATGTVQKTSYVIDPDQTARPPDGMLAHAVLLEGGHTVYARFGDVFGYACALLALGLWFRQWLAKRKPKLPGSTRVVP